MEIIYYTIFLIVAITLTGILSKWIPIPYSILLIAVGLLVSTTDVLKNLHLDPEIFFLLFLPPLLYADGWLINLRDFKRYLRSILLLSFGLVIASSFVLAFTLHTIFPAIPFIVALILGAVISPTDAVAIQDLTRSTPITNRISTILNGESLVNDASGLIIFNFALYTLNFGFSYSSVLESVFVKIPLGILIGFGVAWISLQIRLLIQNVHGNPIFWILISLMTPYFAYITAVQANASAILSIVIAGLYNGYIDPLRMNSQTRLNSFIVWEIWLHILNGFVFLVLGIQLPNIFKKIEASSLELASLVLITFFVVTIFRILWVFPGALLPRFLFTRIRKKESEPNPRHIFFVGWAGVRGAVTLAAALSIPFQLQSGEPFPYREKIIFIASSIIILSLLVNGLTLPMLVRILKIQDDGEIAKEEKLARIHSSEDAAKALRQLYLEGTSNVDEEFILNLIEDYQEKIDKIRAMELSQKVSFFRLKARKEIICIALEAEKRSLLHLYTAGRINDETLRKLQRALDVEETWINERLDASSNLL